MSLHIPVRPIDNQRCAQAATAWFSNDHETFVAVLKEADADIPEGSGGLLIAAFSMMDLMSRTSGPLIDNGPDLDPRGPDTAA